MRAKRAAHPPGAPGGGKGYRPGPVTPTRDPTAPRLSGAWPAWYRVDDPLASTLLALEARIMTDMWSDLVWAALADLKTRLMLVLPGILAMLTLAAVGLAGAWISARVARRLAQAVAFDRRADAWGIVAALNRAGVRKPPSQVLGLIVFWSVLVLFLPVAIDALAIPGTGRLTEFVFSWVPRVMGAALILLVGWLVANFLGEGVLIAAVNARLPEARLLARAIRWGVLLFASATAITHLGIGKEMVLVAFGITFGGLIFALALAFGLGGRGLARQILERHLRGREPHPRETLTHL